MLVGVRYCRRRNLLDTELDHETLEGLLSGD